jgi:predicted transcriptional regulator
MAKRRTRADLLCEVMESIDSGINKPTHILYNTKVSWTVLTEILDLLHTKDYIAKTELNKSAKKVRVHYGLTEEGKNILTSMKFLRDSLQVNG